jgi:hypothetical protein
MTDPHIFTVTEVARKHAEPFQTEPRVISDTAAETIAALLVAMAESEAEREAEQ